MLDHHQRVAILELRKQGHGSRRIAKALGISRVAVQAVVKSRSVEVPQIERQEKAEPHAEDIVALYASCKGNLVRVHEELTALGADYSYPALTAFCRRHRLGKPAKQPAGEYHFKPGQEMQHDTSPHQVKIRGRLRGCQTASVVCCGSRMIFMQLYPRFTRFHCKVFLTDAVQYFGGACHECMIDNTHVVVLKGTGVDMVPVPEMAAFSERLGFTFKAHEKGDANRSARVEGPFQYIENNFLAGRDFESFADANRAAVTWCDKDNATFKRKLGASHRDLFLTERQHLQPLPAWVPPVYALHQRIVDGDGYVNVHGNRYTAPWRLMGRQMEVRETKDRIEVFDGPRLVASHLRNDEETNVRVKDDAHRPPRGEGRNKRAPPPEEAELIRIEPLLGVYVGGLKKHRTGQVAPSLRRLLRLVREYPREAFLAALKTASAYGLYDLERLERLVLKNIASDYFILPMFHDDDEDPDDEG
jgi:hypothetical protein